MDRSKMEPRITSGPKMGTHFVDIHEVLHEDEEEEETSAIRADKGPETKRFNKPQRFREPKTQQLQNHQRNFSRQVSLETGFSAFKKESKARDDKTVLRSGRSFSGFESGNRNGMDGRRGDFSIFKTKSTLSKQNSLLPSTSRKDGIPPDPQKKDGPAAGGTDESKSVPAGRYFAALRGPELDQVKDFEDILLPKDEIWPFLLRFPIGCFGICLGLSSQAVLWHALDISPATKFLHIAPFVNLGLWLLALAFMIAVSCTYMLKCICYFEAIKREYFHPVRVNFFFAPWVVCMFLAISAPPMFVPGKLHPAFFCIFMVPYFLLELKIYGQWLSGGKRRLCKVANPSSHLSVVGNFVGAILASKVGWQEPGKFLWAVGFAHYLVLFVTLYQRLPTSEALPKELHPVYSMFIAAPSAASIAWETIYGEFDGSARTCYFIALFLYISLVVRINFFTGFKFSVAWWSYTFPMTTISVATIKYATHVPCTMTKILALGLSFMSSTMVALLLVSTFLHAFVWKTLFPNDLAIAITTKRQGRDNYKKPMRKSIDLRKWTKQTPLSFVSNMTKHGSAKKNSDGENDEE